MPPEKWLHMASIITINDGTKLTTDTTGLKIKLVGMFE